MDARKVFDGALATLIVYSVTEYSTYVAATTRWLDITKKYADNSFVILVGCRSDIVSERIVEVAEVEQFAHRNNVFFMETSSVEMTNIELTKSLLRIRAAHALDGSSTSPLDGFDVQQPQHDTISSAKLRNRYGRKPRVMKIDLCEGIKDSPGGKGEDLTISKILGRTSSPILATQRQRPAKTLEAISARFVQAAETSLSNTTSSPQPLIPGKHQSSNAHNSASISKVTPASELSGEYAKLKKLFDDNISVPEIMKPSSVVLSTQASPVDDNVHGKSLSPVIEEGRRIMERLGLGSDPCAQDDKNTLAELEILRLPSSAGPTTLRLHRTGSIDIATKDKGCIHFSHARGNPVGELHHSVNGMHKTDLRGRRPSYLAPTASAVARETARHPLSDGNVLKRNGSRVHRRVNLTRKACASGGTTISYPPPPQPYTSVQNSLPQQPRMTGRGGRPADVYVDVNIAGRFIGSIAVREGDNAGLLASEFVREHRLDPRHTSQLSKVVKARIAEYNTEAARKLAMQQRARSRRELECARNKEPTKAQSPQFHSHSRILRRKNVGGRLAKRERVLVGRMHVRVGKGKTGVLVVRRGDNPHEIVENFRRTYALKRSQAKTIETRVRAQLEAFENEFRARHGSATPISYSALPSNTPQSARVVEKTEVVGAAARASDGKSDIGNPDMKALTEKQRLLFQSTLGGTPQSIRPSHVTIIQSRH